MPIPGAVTKTGAFLSERPVSGTVSGKNFCTYCYNVVYNSLPVLLFSNLEELKKAGIRDFRMDFTMESAKEIKAILKLYEEFADGSRRQYPKEWENRYTNGHYKRGVE